MTRVRDFLLDNVGHMTFPGRPSFDSAAGRWLVPIFCRTDRGAVVVGDVETDPHGHIVFAPSREDMLSRLGAASSSVAGSAPQTAAVP